MPIVLADFMNRADVRMVEGGGGSSFTSETFQRLRVMRNFVWQEFQSDETTQLGIFSLIDNSHPTAAQLLDNAIVRDSVPDHWRESYVREPGKSMKALDLAASQKGSWRNIPIALIDLPIPFARAAWPSDRGLLFDTIESG